ncbi:SRPBCC domain-containing protein [Streptomyces carpaticus]|uniref:SRPBCC domain-containing protein n=1 Tax=Streptomyces carpaticus TaxID=285558 RepID=A0ABV4ZVH3_9ACTN
MIPDTIERVVMLRHPIGRVWAALTTPEGLSGWFGSVAEVDLRPGGRAFFRWDDLDDESTATLTVVDPPHRFAFTWPLQGFPPDNAPRTVVEFTLEPVTEGTRLRLVESGFAQAAAGTARSARETNSRGWDAELAELVGHLDAVA